MTDEGRLRAARYLTLAAILNTCIALASLWLFSPWWDHFSRQSPILVEIFRLLILTSGPILAIPTLFAAHALHKHRWMSFVFFVSLANLLVIPFGTLAGSLTLEELAKKSAR